MPIGKKLHQILLLGAILVSSITVKAQTYVGIRGGYNVSTVFFTPTQYQEALAGAGVDVGLALKTYQNKYVGFQGELNLIQRGYTKPYQEVDMYKRVNTYLEVPIFFQIQLPIKRVAIFANAGCYGAFLLSAKEGNNSTGKFEMTEYKLNSLYDKRFDYGLAGGLGLAYEFSFGVFQADYRINFGLANLYNSTWEGMPNHSRSFTQSVNLSYLFPLDLLKRKERKNSEVLPVVTDDVKKDS